jgi:hypothetical protein
MKRILEWVLWVSNPFEWLVSLVGKGAGGLSKDLRSDPIYKKNVQRLVDYHRQFEKKE